MIGPYLRYGKTQSPNSINIDFYFNAKSISDLLRLCIGNMFSENVEEMSISAKRLFCLERLPFQDR